MVRLRTLTKRKGGITIFSNTWKTPYQGFLILICQDAQLEKAVDKPIIG